MTQKRPISLSLFENKTILDEISLIEVANEFVASHPD